MVGKARIFHNLNLDAPVTLKSEEAAQKPGYSSRALALKLRTEVQT